MPPRARDSDQSGGKSREEAGTARPATAVLVDDGELDVEHVQFERAGAAVSETIEADGRGVEPRTVAVVLVGLEGKLVSLLEREVG